MNQFNIGENIPDFLGGNLQTTITKEFQEGYFLTIKELFSELNPEQQNYTLMSLSKNILQQMSTDFNEVVEMNNTIEEMEQSEEYKELIKPFPEFSKQMNQYKETFQKLSKSNEKEKQKLIESNQKLIESNQKTERKLNKQAKILYFMLVISIIFNLYFIFNLYYKPKIHINTQNDTQNDQYNNEYNVESTKITQYEQKLI